MVATQVVIVYSGVVFPVQLGENTQSEIWFLHLKKETTKHIVPSFKGVDKIPINHKRTFTGYLYYKNLVILYLFILYCTVL